MFNHVTDPQCKSTVGHMKAVIALGLSFACTKRLMGSHLRPVHHLFMSRRVPAVMVEANASRPKVVHLAFS